MLGTSDNHSLPDHQTKKQLSPQLPFARSGLGVDDFGGNAPVPAVPDEPVIAEPEYLSECSPKDKPWDQHRSQADRVEEIYLSAEESRWLRRLGERVGQCAQVLEFGWCPEKGDCGAFRLKLRDAWFCRVRYCPICAWRRSLLWRGRFREAIPRLVAEHPKARFIFLVLTVRNAVVARCRDAIQDMNKGWGRLTKRKKFAAVLGWMLAPA